MPYFRKKPVVIEAIQAPVRTPDGWTVEFQNQRNAVALFFNGKEEVTMCSDDSWIIPTLEGAMRASPGDWIIKGVTGEFYPCKPDIFAKTYEPAVSP